MYSIKKVSQLLNIPAVTIRAWENRYQVINPSRTEGGHRLYSEKDIQTLKWLKEQVQENHLKISEAVYLLKQSTNASYKKTSVNNSFDEIKTQIFEALTNVDTQEANKITDLAFSLYDYEEVLNHILVDVLYQIGDAWENGQISVAQEHFASQFILNRCSRLFRILPINNTLPRVLAFCPEGEDHHIGLMLFSLFFRKKGFEVIYLGPNTPVNGLLDLIESKNIKLILISMTSTASLNKVKSWINNCLKTHTNLKFIIGGKGIMHMKQTDTHSVLYLTDPDWESWYQLKLNY